MLEYLQRLCNDRIISIINKVTVLDVSSREIPFLRGSEKDHVYSGASAEREKPRRTDSV